MTRLRPKVALKEVRLFDWKSHKAALWWLGVLYRRPSALTGRLGSLTRGVAFRTAARLYLHSLPYVFILSFLLRFALFSSRYTSGAWARLASDTAFGIAGGMAFGIAVAIALGIALWGALGIASGIVVGIVFAIAFGIAGGIAFGIAFGIAGGIAFGIAFAIAFGIVFGIVFGIAFGIAAGIAGGFSRRSAEGIAFGIALGIATGIAFGIATGKVSGIASGAAIGIATGIAFPPVFLRAYYLAPHAFFVWPGLRPQRYPLHPAAWDDLCGTPFPGLGRLLAAFAEIHPAMGAAEIERLINSYPSQRMEALRAQMTLLARASTRITDLARLADIAAQMPRGEGTILKQSEEVAEGLGEIALRQARLNTAQRPMLREPLAEMLIKEIESLRGRIAGFKEPLASEFRAAAVEWRRIAQEQLDEARAIQRRKPVGQVFRAGDPVSREAEAFVYRDSVVGRLDQQITLAAGCPGIVLYARRRMGKSTLLANLDGFLPAEVETRVISMQDASAFTSLQHFAEKLSEGQAADLPGLAAYLSGKNEHLKAQSRRLLLAFDEYEQIDSKIGQAVFSGDLLAVVRESIQQHRHIIWLFAGSHQITELSHAEWTSYLVSARTIEIPFFTLDETRLLLTDPLKHSPLFQRAGERPRFAPELWGTGGIERIHAEAAGWPHLLQLVAETLVDFLNQEGASAVTTSLLERALDDATSSGQNVLYQLMRGECSLAGEWEYLSAFRRMEEQYAPEDDAIRQSLLRRQLIVADGERWRLRAPLMARWLRLRG